MVGTNPDSSSPTALAAGVATYCLARKAAGWDKIILCTLVSRTDGIIANFDTTYAQPYNTIIRGGAWQVASGVDVICDFASNANLGATGAADNATYFVDKIHPTLAGYNIMTPLWTAALNTVVASL